MEIAERRNVLYAIPVRLEKAKACESPKRLQIRYPIVRELQILQTDKIGDDGLIKVGSTVNEGDPLILAYSSPANQPFFYRLRKSKPVTMDQSLTWSETAPGIVTDATQTKDGLRVLVRSQIAAIQGDKLGIRSGGKGIITIIADNDMPRDAQGEPLELLISPLAVVSRKNPAMVVEALLGKSAIARGAPYIMPAFPKSDTGFMQYALDQLSMHGLKPTEELFDPQTDQSIGQVYGGDVIRADKVMHGKTSDINHDGLGVFADLPQPFTATRYHSLIVKRETVPDCFTISAWTEDGMIMGLRHKEHPVEGVQFHPESILTSPHAEVEKSPGKMLLRNFLQG